MNASIKTLVVAVLLSTSEQYPEFKPSVFLLCPFCEREGRIGSAIAGDDEMGPCVLHGEPQCQEYKDMEPDDFLEKVRMALSD